MKKVQYKLMIALLIKGLNTLCNCAHKIT